MSKIDKKENQKLKHLKDTMIAKRKLGFLLHFLHFLERLLSNYCHVQFPFKFFDKILNKSDSENHQPVKVSQFQNEFMKSSFLPKYEQKIVKISALSEID